MHTIEMKDTKKYLLYVSKAIRVVARYYEKSACKDGCAGCCRCGTRIQLNGLHESLMGIQRRIEFNNYQK